MKKPIRLPCRFYTSFIPELTVWWELRGHWTCRTSVPLHVFTFSSIPRCRELGQVRNGRGLIRPARAQLRATKHTGAIYGKFWYPFDMRIAIA